MLNFNIKLSIFINNKNKNKNHNVIRLIIKKRVFPEKAIMRVQ